MREWLRFFQTVETGETVREPVTRSVTARSVTARSSSTRLLKYLFLNDGREEGWS